MSAFALVDCNSFYCSVERAFQPALAKVPVIVLSNNDSSIVARTAEAKALGIKSGQPYFEIRDLVRRHGVRVFSSNYANYAAMSQRVMSILAEFTPHLEIYSIDEAFLSLDGIKQRDLVEYGHEIRARILQWTGLPVCVGIAAGADHPDLPLGTKTMAKFANHLAKTLPQFGGVCDLRQLSRDELTKLFQQTPCTDIWGVGRRTGARLESMGISNALQLRHAPSRWLREQFSVTLERTVLELNGVSCIALEEVSPPKKQIVVSRSFGTPALTVEALQEAISQYVSRAAEKLRLQGAVASQMTVFAHTSLYNQNEPSYSASRLVRLPRPTNDTRILAGAAITAINSLYKPGFRYVKAGVMLFDVGVNHGQQTSLWDVSDINRSDTLMHVMDSINSRMGKNTLQVASSAIQEDWQMRRNRLSPSYMTRWSDIPIVSCRE